MNDISHAARTAIELIHVMSMMDKLPTVIPSIPAPAANPSCTKELFRLSRMPEASGASETSLKF